MEKNRLYFGDNLHWLREAVASESIDLIYLDPPFNSDRDYNLIYREKSGAKAAAQIQAFRDTWTWDVGPQSAYEEVVREGDELAQAMRAFRQLLHEGDEMAYLAMMAPRLKELHRVLKATGSIYLHCDPTASHYLKILMDSIFGKSNFQNEVIWWYRKWSKSPNRFLRNHDVLLFYAKSPKHTFNILRVPLSPSTVKRFGGKRQDFADEARTRKIATEEESEGGFRPDVWTHNLLAAHAAERLGYPTQKPLALLETAIEASSNPDDVVLDPFCGCGTTIDAAQQLGRRWIGMDITYLAINTVQARLRDRYGEAIQNTYEVHGAPVSLPDAESLAQRDKYQFQWWAATLAGARIAPSDQKKGPDRGIDGRITFFDEMGGDAKEMILSVKGGTLKADDVRALRHVVEREGAQMGCLITLNPPTAGMRADAATAGFYTSPDGKSHPRIQIATIKDLLDGKPLAMPRGVITGRLLKQAARASRTDIAQAEMLFSASGPSDPDDSLTPN